MQFILSSGNPFELILWEKIDGLNASKYSTIEQRRAAERKAAAVERLIHKSRASGISSTVETNVRQLAHLRTKINHLLGLEMIIDDAVTSMETCSTQEDLARSIDTVNRISNYVYNKYMNVTATQEKPDTSGMMDDMRQRLDSMLGKPAQVSVETVRMELGLSAGGPSLREQIESEFKDE